MFKTQIKDKVKHVSLWLGGSPLKKANFSAFSHFCIALHWWISDQKEFSLFFQGATVWHSGNSVTCLISLLLSFELSPNNNQVSSEDVDLQTLVWGLFWSVGPQDEESWEKTVKDNWVCKTTIDGYLSSHHEAVQSHTDKSPNWIQELIRNQYKTPTRWSCNASHLSWVVWQLSVFSHSSIAFYHFACPTVPITQLA